MLLALHDFIRREKLVSTQQLMREFSLDLQALIPMLDCWARKGVINKSARKMACKSSCFRCDTEGIEYYEYRG